MKQLLQQALRQWKIIRAGGGAGRRPCGASIHAGGNLYNRLAQRRHQYWNHPAMEALRVKVVYRQRIYETVQRIRGCPKGEHLFGLPKNGGGRRSLRASFTERTQVSMPANHRL
jgi:hypothetical protein